jgi:hypothetical protein
MKQKFRITRTTTIIEVQDIDLEVPKIDLSTVIPNFQASEPPEKTVTHTICSVGDLRHFHVFMNPEPK